MTAITANIHGGDRVRASLDVPKDAMATLMTGDNFGDNEHAIHETLHQSTNALDPHFVDRILSKELLKLSLKDRNAIDEEIHGVSSLAPKESPEFLEKALQELSRELRDIPDDLPSKSCYTESQILPETYVNKPDFRLRFLRCELFDAKKAAIRLVKFLDLASDLFGPEVLQRPVRITDFSKEEEKLLRLGNLQILPYPDRSGRRIYTRVGDFGFEDGNLRYQIRMNLYFLYSLADDVDSQQKGITKLLWVGSNTFSGALPRGEGFVYYKKLMEAIPIRTCVNHYCVPDTPYFHMLRFKFAMTQGPNRSRLKFHIGEEVEVLYKLKTFGIPIELIPVTGTGNIKTAYHKQWMRARKLLETNRTKGIAESRMIVCPSSNDVLFRAGATLTFHPGNFALQGMIESRIEEHVAASQTEKKAITKAIIATVRQREGRFLLWNAKGWWTEMDDPSLIHIKVAACVKGFKFKPVANRQVSQSSTFVFQNQDNGWRKRRKLFHDDGSNSDASSCGEGGCCF